MVGEIAIPLCGNLPTSTFVDLMPFHWLTSMIKFSLEPLFISGVQPFPFVICVLTEIQLIQSTNKLIRQCMVSSKHFDLDPAINAADPVTQGNADILAGSHFVVVPFIHYYHECDKIHIHSTDI